MTFRVSRSSLVILILAAALGCKHKKAPPKVCVAKSSLTPAEVADAGSSDDAGFDAGLEDAGALEDAGSEDAGLTEDAGEADASTVDAGTATDAGETGDAGVTDAGDAGDLDAGLDAGEECVEETEPDAGICANIPCRSDTDCCDGTTCQSSARPTCPFCDLTPVDDCSTSSPCDLVTSTCISQGADSTCSCPTGPIFVCQPNCQTNGCPTGYSCNALTQVCEVTPCGANYTCPAWATCTASGGANHGCVGRSCAEDADCTGGGTCVSHVCKGFTGTCQY